MIRLPMDPLLDVVGGSWNELFRRTGVPTSQLFRDHGLGGVSPLMADRMSVAIGRTPAELWGDVWFDLPDGVFGPMDMPTPEQAARAEVQRAKDRERKARKQQELLDAAAEEAAA